MESWIEAWQELRRTIPGQPRCPEHPDYPCVHTLVQGVPNDIIDVSDAGILVRSHRTMNEDFIEAGRFERWWQHLIAHGSASIDVGDPHNPHRWRSRIVGAILAAGLPRHVRYTGGSTLEYLGRP
jgi:hypothetical protein